MALIFSLAYVRYQITSIVISVGERAFFQTVVGRIMWLVLSARDIFGYFSKINLLCFEIELHFYFVADVAAYY